MKLFWKTQILEMAQSYIFSVKLHSDHNAVIENRLRLLYVQLQATLYPKNTLQNALKKSVFNAISGKPLRVNSDSDVTQTHLG